MRKCKKDRDEMKKDGKIEILPAQNHSPEKASVHAIA